MSLRLRPVLGEDLASSAIALFSAGYYSHVDVITEKGELLGAREDSIGGKSPGVQVRPFGYEKVKRADVYELTTAREQDAQFWAFAYKQLGKPYDKPGIWGFVFGRDWHEPGSWFCSELIAAACEAAGIVHTLVFPPNKVTPAELIEVWTALGAVKIDYPKDTS